MLAAVAPGIAGPLPALRPLSVQVAVGCQMGLYPDFFDTGSDEGLPGVLRRHAPPVLRRIKGSGPQALQQSGDSKLTYFG